MPVCQFQYWSHLRCYFESCVINVTLILKGKEEEFYRILVENSDFLYYIRKGWF